MAKKVDQMISKRKNEELGDLHKKENWLDRRLWNKVEEENAGCYASISYNLQDILQ